ncbi:MAG: hypothetical protein K8S23_01895 [Candidatus Cloacimonetes bacterium]|nr:hypothetical protein [Candidatus Cloacimonadota bacterium]
MIYIFLLLALVVSIFYYKKTVPELSKKQKVFLGSLRFISLAIIFILLLNPILYFFYSSINKPEVIILHDNSESMNQKIDDSSKKQMLDNQTEELKKIFAKSSYEVTDFNFANGLYGKKNTTNISKTIFSLVKDHNLKNTQRIVLASDGWLHDENISALIDLNIPFYTFKNTAKIDNSDLKITSLKTNLTAYQDDIVPIEINIQAESFAGMAKLKLFIGNKAVEERKIDFSKSNYQQILFDHTFKSSGLNKIRAEIKQDTLQEIYKDNNFADTAIQIHKSRSKSLVISDVMNWDSKYILQSFNKNFRWETDFLLKHKNLLMKSRKNVKLVDNLNEIELLILINYGKIRFSTEECALIKKYVENGGGLLFMGNPLNCINDVLPVKNKFLSKNFQTTFHLTNLSKKYQTFQIGNALKNIPPVNYAYVEPKLQAQILAQFDNPENSPAILFSNYEKGKVLFLPFINLWKWQLHSQTNNFSEFVLQVADWLGSEETNRFLAKSNKIFYNIGENVNITLSAFDEKLVPVERINAKIILKNDNNFSKESYLVRKDQKFVSTFSDFPKGKYNYKITDEISGQKTSGEFIISENNPEAFDLGFNNQLLKYIAEQTGGEFLSKDQILIDDLETIPAIKETIGKEIPLYKKWYVILLFILSFCLELFWRKRWGLL